MTVAEAKKLVNSFDGKGVTYDPEHPIRKYSSVDPFTGGRHHFIEIYVKSGDMDILTDVYYALKQEGYILSPYFYTETFKSYCYFSSWKRR